MPIIKYFTCCCSVRLGSIAISILNVVESIIFGIFCITWGEKGLRDFFHYANDQLSDDEPLVKALLEELILNSRVCFGILIASQILHGTACILAIHGSLKLQKWHLIPLCVSMALKVVFMLSFHVIFMIIVKQNESLGLGILILGTVTGGFIILYCGYEWTCLISLFQILHWHPTRYVTEIGSKSQKNLDDGKLKVPNKIFLNLAMADLNVKKGNLQQKTTLNWFL